MPRYTDKQIIAALKLCRGMVYVAADNLGCSPNTIKKRINDSPNVKAAADEAAEIALDRAELSLFQAVVRGEPWAVQFMLRTKGKSRGYNERVEIDVTLRDAARKMAEQYDDLDESEILKEVETILSGGIE